MSEGIQRNDAKGSHTRGVEDLNLGMEKKLAKKKKKHIQDSEIVSRSQ